MTAVVRRLSGNSFLLVAPDGGKILINCQEGCQRSFLEYAQHLSSVTCICISSVQEMAGGLPGTLLTILDSAPESSKVQIVGPSPLTGSFLHSLRHFMNLKERVKVVEPPPTIETPFPTGFYSIRMLFPVQPVPNAESCRKRPRSIEETKASFVFQTPRLPGKFQPQKAMELNVPRGPLFAQLVRGESVTLANGIVVSSDQVITPDSPPLSILVLHYDSISPTLMAEALRAVQGTTIELVLHIVPHRELFESYGRPVWESNSAVHQQCHIVQALHPQRTECNAAKARSMLCPLVFSTLTENNTSMTAREDERWEYVLIPRKGAGWKLIPNDFPESQLAHNLVESTGAFSLAQSILQSYQTLPERDNDVGKEQHSSLSIKGTNTINDEAITFLGTGCAIPCKYRNVSGIYVEPHGLILDVGEGTWAQMQTLSLPTPRVIWISHPHADHHLGLITVLRHTGNKECPLLVIAPRPVQQFLLEYAETVDSQIANVYEYIECSNEMVISEQHNSMLAACGIMAVHAVPVAHCAHSYAGVFDTLSRWKRIVYSGDCRPSNNLKMNWKNCNVLIHEATFADDRTAEAVLKKHCTVHEAVTVGKAMKAQHVILTHFSQRYPKAPPPYPEKDVVFAHDYMRLTPNTMPLARLLTSAIRKLYPDEVVADKDSEPVGVSPEELLLSTPGLFADPKLLQHS